MRKATEMFHAICELASLFMLVFFGTKTLGIFLVLVIFFSMFGVPIEVSMFAASVFLLISFGLWTVYRAVGWNGNEEGEDDEDDDDEDDDEQQEPEDDPLPAFSLELPREDFSTRGYIEVGSQDEELSCV